MNFVVLVVVWSSFLQVRLIVPLLLAYCACEMATKTVPIEFNNECYQVSFQSAAHNGGPSDLHTVCEATAAAGTAVSSKQSLSRSHSRSCPAGLGRPIGNSTVVEGDSTPDKSVLEASLKCVQVRYEELRLCVSFPFINIYCINRPALPKCPPAQHQVLRWTCR